MVSVVIRAMNDSVCWKFARLKPCPWAPPERPSCPGEKTTLKGFALRAVPSADAKREWAGRLLKTDFKPSEVMVIVGWNWFAPEKLWLAMTS